MKRLLTLSTLITAMLFAQPAYAQQDTTKDNGSIHNMEMMQDSTMHNGMMSMKSDSTHQGMIPACRFL